MLTMSLRNKAISLIFLLLPLAFGFGCVSAAQACAWQIKVGMRPGIELNGHKLKIDRALAKRLSAADEAAVLPADLVLKNGARAKWLVLRTPSRLRGDAGFCGAGHEDRLLLLRANSENVRVTGEFLVQSCLSSISMDVDQLNELIAALNQDPHSGDFVFQQSVSSETQSFRRDVRIKIENGRLKVDTRETPVVE
jgi:hypothetical protein